MDNDNRKDDPLYDIRTRYKKATEYWQDDRDAALDDIKFRSGEQWPEQIKSNRERDKRPCLTVDKLNQYVRQIVNDGRQNRPSIKVRPVDSGADVATAEVFQGVIKHIEDRSGADAAYDTALDSAATGGFGYFTVSTEYCHDDTFDQEIVIKRVRNPLSIIIDPASREADGSDMKYAFEIEELDKDDFEEMYPGKTPDDFSTSDDYGDWYGDKVRIARYWYVEEQPRKLHMLQDGKVIADDMLQALKDEGIDVTSEIVETRDIPKRVVKHALVSGKDYLEKPQEWKGKWIPILVVWGNEIDVEGKVCHSGIIRPAKDSQRLYNYSRSAFAERVALTPKAPWVAAEGQIDDYADEWATANTDNHSVLRYRPTALNGSPVPPPQRQTLADIPAGFQADMQVSEHDIQGAIGMYNASLGAPSNERSGKAIMARQKEGDVGTFHYHDNLNRAIRHCGRILVDLIPYIYDSNRVVRILGYDGAVGEAEIDPNIPTASQQRGVQMVYNLGVGRYDVTISTGPSYSTMRQEAVSAMIEMTQANPALMQIAGDIMVKNMDWPGAEELSERLKLMLPPQIMQAEQAKDAQKLPPQMQQFMDQLNQQLQQKDALINRAADEIQKIRAELDSKEDESEAKDKEIRLKAIQVEIDAFRAESERMEKLKEYMTPQQIQMIVMQTLQDLMQPNVPQEMVQEQPEQPEPQEMEHESDGMAVPPMPMNMANVGPQPTGYPME